MSNNQDKQKETKNNKSPQTDFVNKLNGLNKHKDSKFFKNDSKGFKNAFNTALSILIALALVEFLVLDKFTLPYTFNISFVIIVVLFIAYAVNKLSRYLRANHSFKLFLNISFIFILIIYLIAFLFRWLS